MYAPEYTPKKCPWWHRLFKRFKWFRYYCRWCMPIKFESVTLPVVKAKLPKLDLQGLANVMPLTTERIGDFEDFKRVMGLNKETEDYLVEAIVDAIQNYEEEVGNGNLDFPTCMD